MFCHYPHCAEEKSKKQKMYGTCTSFSVVSGMAGIQAQAI